MHPLAVARVVDIKCLEEIRLLVAGGYFHATESGLLRALLHAGLVEQGLKRHAAPARIAHRAVAQLTAGEPWIEKSAAVARALVDGNQFDGGQLSYFLQGQL